jgi:uncharacterized membrane protein
MSTNIEFLASVPFLSLLDADEQATLSTLMSREVCKAGKTIFEVGLDGDSMYVVVSGHVHVYAESPSGEKIVLAECDPGDVFGEISLLDGGPRNSTAMAMEETELLRLDRGDLLQLFGTHPHAAIDLITVIGKGLRESNERMRTHVTRNANTEAAEQMTFGQRIADKVASFGGSWYFIILFASIIIVWITINSIALMKSPFDAYPYILLNLVLSLVSAIQAPVIMMSQNRQSEKDRIKTDLDYQVNLKAELEVAHLHEKIDRVYQHLQHRFAIYEKERRAAGELNSSKDANSGH